MGWGGVGWGGVGLGGLGGLGGGLSLRGRVVVPLGFYPTTSVAEGNFLFVWDSSERPVCCITDLVMSHSPRVHRETKGICQTSRVPDCHKEPSTS